MKTDALFYELIRELPQIFFKLIGEPDTNTNAYKFNALEVKQQSFRLDGLFSTVEGFEKEPLYFVEFQTYKDEEFYERLLGEIFVYFRQNKPPNSDWYAIVIYDRQSNEVAAHPRYKNVMNHHVRQIYLNKLPKNQDEALEIGIARLFVETPKKSASLARKLVGQAQNEITDANLQQEVLAFIQAIFFYKFPNTTTKEIETMLNLSDFKKSRLYQSVREETWLELVPKLLKRGLSIEEIAETLEMDVEEIRKAAQQQQQ